MNANIFRENAIDFKEAEVLEHVLSFSGTKANKEELAHNLLEAFGSLKAVIEARPEQLETVNGIGKKTADFISSFLPMFKVYKACLNDDPGRIGNSREAENCCLSLLAGNRIEEFYVICLNAQCKVVGKRKISTGSIAEVSAYPRIVTETALNYNAHSVLLAHNHPGGTCAPSPEDITSTIQIQKLLSMLGILVLDHIIVANDKTYSMIQHGDIDYRARR